MNSRYAIVLFALALDECCAVRFALATDISPIPNASRITDVAMATVPFDLAKLKPQWLQRIKAIREAGMTPIIDVESNPARDMDIQYFARRMDELGVAMIAFSGIAKNGWSNDARYAVAADHWRYIPTGDGGLPPDWKEDPIRFAAVSRERIVKDGYPMMGEYEFRHYPSPDQIRRRKLDRDEKLPLDSAAGELLFKLSEETGIPFQIHQEIEDQYLPVLEKMLGRYPGAKVIWCHLAQMRYQERNTIYGPDYVRKLIEKFPNLYFDLAAGGPDHVYPLSNQYPGKYWDRTARGLKKEWAELISDHPWRFLAAFDLNPNVMTEFANRVAYQRAVLESLPGPARDVVAYKAAWKLLFGEEL